MAFTIQPLPAPAALSPNGPMTAFTPTYKWSPSSGATQYFLQVKDSNNVNTFQSFYTASAICSEAGCAVTPSLVLAAGSYTWAVQAKNQPSGGTWSAEKAFTVFGCAGEVKTGDFDGDGRTDRLCSGEGGVIISLAAATGFATGTVWLAQPIAKPLVGDFDGDGRSDVARFDPATGTFSVALSGGSSFGALQSWGTATGGSTCLGPSATADVGDFNGDGRTDVSCKLNSSDSVFVGLSSGSSANGLSFSIFGHAACEGTGTERTGTLDVNGDGKSDWYCLGRGNDLLLVFPSNGTSFALQPQAISASDSSFCDDVDLFFGDFNGDGKTDISCKSNGRIRFSTGNAYLDVGGSAGGWCPTPTSGTWPYLYGADLDGDGADEMVCNATTRSGSVQVSVRKWQGTSLGPPQQWLLGFCWDTTRAGDFDGDGKMDLLCDNTGVWASTGTPAVRADLMSQASGGLGGTVTVSYTPSTAFSNQPGVAPRYAATAVTVADGRGGSSSTAYSYAGARVDRQERRFLGFQTFRIDPPCLPESGCPNVITTFSQGLASAGKPLDIQRHDGTGFLLSRQTYQYIDGRSQPRKSLLRRSDSYTYDTSGGALQTWTTYNRYDAYGNLTQMVSGGGAGQNLLQLQTDFTYVLNAPAYIVDRVAKVERRVPGQAALQTELDEYDQTDTVVKGDLTAVSRYLNLESRYVTRRMTYDNQGSLLTATDETGRTVTTDYQASPLDFLPFHVKNALNETTTLGWDPACGAVTSTTDPNSNATTQTYDSLCRPSRTTDPLGGYVQRYYQNLGDPTAQKTRAERLAATGVSGVDWSENYFDGLGRSYKTTRRGPAAGQDTVIERTYNNRGSVASTTEPYYGGDPPRVTQYRYDALDRLVRTVLPDQNDITTDYLAAGQVTTDPNGKSVTTRFDAFGRTTQVERTFGGSPAVTSTTYDILGRPIGIQDAASNSWTYQYDSLGRRWDEQDPDLGHWTYTYDDAGRPTSHTDAKAQETTMTYDPVGRIQTKTSPVGTVTFAYGEPRSGYFNVGRLTTVTSPLDILALDHDKVGRTTRAQRTLPQIASYTATKTYDAGGYLQTTNYPDNDVVGPLGYDEAGRLKSIPGIVTGITYDAAGRPTEMVNANGAATTWTYDADRGFLTGIQTSAAAGTIQNLTYSHDAAGLIQGLAQRVAGTPGEAWTYGYDDLYHLTSATDGNTPANSQTWQYDSVDRILANSRVPGTYAYPAAGQPRPHAPLTVSGVTYTYDPNGNLTSGNGRAPIWDAENRIASIGGTSFGYDAFGERLTKVSSSSTSLYPFGDDYEDTNGTVTKYISVEGLGVVAKRVGSGMGATTYWLHTDGLGSIQAVTDAAGAPVLARTYRAYGETLSQSGKNMESRGWIDQRNDTETGLTYLHARYFDPKLGTFLSPDPIGVDGGLNQYGYGFGSPVNLADSSGLAPEWPGLTCWFGSAGTWSCEGQPGGGDGGSSGGGGHAVPRPGRPGSGGTGGGGYYGGICIGGGCAAPVYLSPSLIALPFKGITSLFNVIFGGGGSGPHNIPWWRTRPPHGGTGAPTPPAPLPPLAPVLISAPVPEPTPAPGPAPAIAPPSSSIRFPDYISISVNVTVPNPLTGTLAGVSGQVAFDVYGNFYWSPGATVGPSTFASGSLTAGWVDTEGRPTVGRGRLRERDLRSFLSGVSKSWGGGFGLGVQRSWNENGRAWEYGLFSPQLGRGWHYSIPDPLTPGEAPDLAPMTDW
jgi:RHS repeat-associated protein